MGRTAKCWKAWAHCQMWEGPRRGYRSALLSASERVRGGRGGGHHQRVWHTAPAGWYGGPRLRERAQGFSGHLLRARTCRESRESRVAERAGRERAVGARYAAAHGRAGTDGARGGSPRDVADDARTAAAAGSAVRQCTVFLVHWIRILS
eukprot:SAG11_NODE_2649_length_3126_cov_9.746614_2_plen_150_part_00